MTLRIAGLDIGFALNRKSSGVAIARDRSLSLSREFGGRHACARILAAGPFDVVAIDGPIVPEGHDRLAVRAVERLFASGPFQRRCKPGSSHVTGTGLMLRKAAGDAADWLGPAAPLGRTPAPFPAVRAGAVVEAFPNAFLGVCLSESTYGAMPPLGRGTKFDWLYDRWVEQEIVAQLPFLTAMEAGDLQRQFEATANHDERAALVCLLTAWSVARGDFTAVGDDAGGWFFLPPWRLWEPWARAAVEAGCTLNAAGAMLRIESSSLRERQPARRAAASSAECGGAPAVGNDELGPILRRAAMAIASETLRAGDALLVVDVQNDFCPGGALPIEDEGETG